MKSNLQFCILYRKMDESIFFTLPLNSRRDAWGSWNRVLHRIGLCFFFFRVGMALHIFFLWIEFNFSWVQFRIFIKSLSWTLFQIKINTFWIRNTFNLLHEKKKIMYEMGSYIILKNLFFVLRNMKNRTLISFWIHAKIHVYHIEGSLCTHTHVCR